MGEYYKYVNAALGLKMVTYFYINTKLIEHGGMLDARRDVVRRQNRAHKSMDPNNT